MGRARILYAGSRFSSISFFLPLLCPLRKGSEGELRFTCTVTESSRLDEHLNWQHFLTAALISINQKAAR